MQENVYVCVCVCVGVCVCVSVTGVEAGNTFQEEPCFYLSGPQKLAVTPINKFRNFGALCCCCC